MKDLEYVKKELENIAHITIVDSTFIMWSKKATFLDDEFGEWIASVKNVVGPRKTTHPTRSNLRRSKSNATSQADPKVKAKRVKTNMKLYGHKTGATPESLEKTKATNMERYGMESLLANGGINRVDPTTIDYEARAQKIKETNLERYGVEWTMQSTEIAQKSIDAKIENGTIKRIEGKSVKELSIELSIPRTSLNSLINIYGPDIGKIKARYESKITDIEQLLIDEGLTRCGISKYSYRPDFELANNIYVNADGLYWHSDKIKDKNYHFNLRKIMEDNNEQILQFRSDEIKNKINIVMSVINAKQGIFTNTYFARKTEIIKIDGPTVARQFLEDNHLMGYRYGKHIALKYEGEIVAIMSYTIRDGILKVERFCNKINITVTGGFSKLLKSLERSLGIKEIHNWVDLRYGTGYHLKDKGFIFSHDTLSFKWTNNKETYHRLKCVAKDGKTETEVAKELGIHKIHDAGQRLYIKRIGCENKKDNKNGAT